MSVVWMMCWLLRYILILLPFIRSLVDLESPFSAERVGLSLPYALSDPLPGLMGTHSDFYYYAASRAEGVA